MNGSHEIDNESQASQLSDTALHQQTIDILVEEKAELLKTRDKQNSNIQQLKGLCLLSVATCLYFFNSSGTWNQSLYDNFHDLTLSS